MKKNVCKFRLTLLILMLLTIESLCSNSNYDESINHIWKELFMDEKPSMPCTIKIKNSQSLLNKSKTGKDKNGLEVIETKKWGFEDAAYLFDYLDPILQAEVVKEFKTIYETIMKIPNNDNNIPNSLTDPLKKKIYLASANFNQLSDVQKSFRWNIKENNIRDFIKYYDLNHDGRLSPKELILASIDSNYVKNYSKKCTNCYENVIKTVNAIFGYVDCGTGYISAEQIWKSLSKLKRNSDSYDIYKIYDKSNRKMTNSINDFILKNMDSKTGQLNQKEFLSGILLGYWDRQVMHEKIIDDNTKNLKNLRWKNF